LSPSKRAGKCGHSFGRVAGGIQKERSTLGTSTAKAFFSCM
jgi:hypothetical protein